MSTEPEVQKEAEELGQLIEWHDVLKKQNDKSEKQRYVVPNRAMKRAQQRKKAKRG